MTQEVTEFVVFAPASMGKAVDYVRGRILDRLARSFPQFEFSLEAFGPFIEADEFAVVPVMGVAGLQEPGRDPDEVFFSDPPAHWVIPAIKEVLREFELTPGLH